MKSVQAHPNSAPLCTVSMRVIRAIVIAIGQAGVPKRELLRAAGLKQELLDSDVRIPRASAANLLEVAIDLTGDHAFGLHWLERLNAATFSPITYLVAHASTLREGIDAFSRFFGLMSDETGFFLAETDRSATLTCATLPELSMRLQRLSAELLIGHMLRLIRSHGVGAFHEVVSFVHSAPAYRGEYERIFDRPPLFDQPFSGVTFDLKLLDRPSPHRDPDIFRALENVAQEQLAAVRPKPCSARVREILVRSGCARPVAMSDVARALGMSSRSLRRHLLAEGRPYRSVEQAALTALAQQSLSDTRLSIQEVAHRMGFAHPTAFYRAFKRWTGMTPSSFRECQATTTASAPPSVKAAR